MRKIGFDNDKYLSLQTQRILERVDSFGGKLYLEFGGKLFDDYHAARVLPGFHPDSKMKMLLKLKSRQKLSSSSTPVILRKTSCAAIWALLTTRMCCV